MQSDTPAANAEVTASRDVLLLQSCLPRTDALQVLVAGLNTVRPGSLRYSWPIRRLAGSISAIAVEADAGRMACLARLWRGVVRYRRAEHSSS